MASYLVIAQIAIAIALILATVLQVKGGGLGGIFGQADTVYRTRRGLEKSLYRLTIVLAVLFVLLSVLSARLAG